MSVQDNLIKIKNKYSCDEFVKLWKKLFESARDLDSLYEASKDAVYSLKTLYNDIKHTEQLNDALRFVYYDALTKKTKHENDRDTYFECDAKLSKMRSGFIDESQQFGFACSKYIEYSQRFSLKREEIFSQFLDEFGKVAEKVSTLNSEKLRLNKEVEKQKVGIRGLREKNEKLNTSFEKLKTTNIDLEQERNNFKKEWEWAQRQNLKLQETNIRLEKEISKSRVEMSKLTCVKDEQEATNKELARENNELMLRCAQLDTMLKSYSNQITIINTANEKKEALWEEENNKMILQLSEAKKQLNTARESNSKTITKNQELRKRIKQVNHSVEKVTKEKLVTVLKEHKTKKANVEMATKQIELINEVLELKKDFFLDQARIRDGSRLNRKLELDVQILQEKVNKLKENPQNIDPLLDGAKEYRKQIMRKFGARRVTLSDIE